LEAALKDTLRELERKAARQNTGGRQVRGVWWMYEHGSEFACLCAGSCQAASQGLLAGTETEELFVSVRTGRACTAFVVATCADLEAALKDTLRELQRKAARQDTGGRQVRKISLQPPQGMRVGLFPEETGC
jgi:hypothetical protein